MTARIERKVVHFGEHDPRGTVGGVESFARNLQTIFEEVDFMTPRSGDWDRVRRERLPVICDNHWVLKLPSDVHAIAFQHGVAAVKQKATKKLSHHVMAFRQWRASRRPRTLWVACAEWISRTFAQRYGNPAKHVIYHPVDIERFDGRLDNAGSNLVLHDARTEHKGRDLLPAIERAFPDFRFETLSCKPEEVPDRMRKARAFLHLSRYEGNSIVCNEAMAMDLPGFFTRVGLMQDADGPTDPVLIDPNVAFENEAELLKQVGAFLGSLDTRKWNPRAWTLAHATPEHARATWRLALTDFDEMASRG